MHIQSLTLTHFRAAQNLTLTLDPELNILVGVNGVGKTTVLDATAILLSWIMNRIQRPGASGLQISQDDITLGQPFASLAGTLIDEPTRLEWRSSKSRKGRTHPHSQSHLSHLNEYTQQIQSRITATDGKTNIPLFVYYPVDRAVTDIPLRVRNKPSFALMNAYDNALKGGSNFRSFFSWFREREDLENENRKYLDWDNPPPDICFPDPQLEAVRRALGRFLPEFEHLTVRRNPLRMEILKAGQPLKVNQLSDGEKCLLALVADLARRLAIANPLGDPLTGQGIVLLDEIDLHLHPQWQRLIISRLTAIFPNCQFIVSTHSPHVLTHVHPEKILLLQNQDGQIQVRQAAESYGKTVDRILEDLMELSTTRPAQVEADLQQIFDWLEANQIEAAKEGIRRIKQEIGEDPDLVKAEVLIRRKELIGR